MPSGQFRKPPTKPDHKWCTLCNVEKPYSEFGNNRTTTDGKGSHCKPCRVAYNNTPERKARRDELNAAYILSEEQKARKAEQSKSPHRKRKARERNKRKYHNDPVYRLRQRVATSIRKTLSGHAKGSRTFDMLPYTPSDLRDHLEALFVPGMTWENYGKAWHIDHIVPQSLFDMTDQVEIAKCWDLSNLMPLWKHLNLMKRDIPLFELPDNWREMPDYAK